MKTPLVLRYLFFVLLLHVCAFGNAQQQDCTLGIGGKDTETIVEVFQINEEQKTQMNTWIQELTEKNKVIEEEIKTLLENHPQSTQDDLITLAAKYKVLKDQIVSVSKMYDIKLLSIFNDKQYQRYVDLCREALRDPMMVPNSTSLEEVPE